MSSQCQLTLAACRFAVKDYYLTWYHDTLSDISVGQSFPPHDALSDIFNFVASSKGADSRIGVIGEMSIDE